MARRRFFVDQVRKGQAEIGGESAHHLTRVLRVEAGQKFEISDGSRVWLASVDAARKDLVRFSILEELAPALQIPAVTLYLALIKFDSFEWAVEKATELGVAGIVPFEATRSERGLFEGSRKRLERWRRIAHEAGEQSRRLAPPDIAESARFAQVLGDASTHRVWLDEEPGAKPLVGTFEFNSEASVALVVGPEGGWTGPERDSFAQAGWIAASLGPSVLRAETAVCASLAVLNQMWLSRVSLPA